MRLALQMGKTLEELFATIGDWEFPLWLAYYQLEPFGNEWLQTASLESQQYNLHARKPGDPAKYPVDFMPVQRKKEQPVTSLAQLLRESGQGDKVVEQKKDLPD